MAGGTPVVTQRRFRFVADSGAPAGASPTFLETENTDRESAADTILHLRMQYDNTGDGAGVVNFLYAQRNGTGGYNQVTLSSASTLGLYIANSSLIAAGTLATSSFALTTGTGTAANGYIFDNDDAQSNGLAAGAYHENTYTLAISGDDSSPGDFWDIRGYGTLGGALNSYTVTPRLTYAAAGTIETGAGSAAGHSTAAAGGDGRTALVGAAAGHSTASAVGRSTAESDGAADGTSTANGVGASVASVSGEAAGHSTASAESDAFSPAVGEADGTSTAEAVGVADAYSTGEADGTSTATAVSEADKEAVGLAVGHSTAEGFSDPGASVGSAVGTSTAEAVSEATAASVGLAVGTSTAVGTSEAGSGVGAAIGTSTAQGVFEAFADFVGSAVGTSEANGVLEADAETTGTAVGTSTAHAEEINAINPAVGVATGSGTAMGGGAVILRFVGRATGGSTASAVGDLRRRPIEVISTTIRSGGGRTTLDEVA